MLYVIAGPINELKVRDKVLAGFSQDMVVLSEFEMNELVQERLNPRINLEIYLLSEKQIESKLDQMNNPIPLELMMDPEEESVLEGLVSRMGGRVPWPLVRRELKTRFCGRFRMRFTVYCRDFTVFLMNERWQHDSAPAMVHAVTAA